MRSPIGALVFAVLWIPLSGETLAQHRISVEPSMEVAEVHDDNLFFSADDPVNDLILRVRPALALQVESPRLSVAGTYGFDSERFADNSDLNNARARERAFLDVLYRVGPRLDLALAGSYTDTDTPAEFNVETGLAASRVRGRRLSLRPSASFQLSPRLSARVTYFSTAEKLTDGREMRAQVHSMSIEGRATPRDRFTFDYEQGFYDFALDTPTGTTNTYVVRAGWTHDVGPGTRLTVQAGPRITDGSPAAELSASLRHDWKFSSIVVSCQQSQTTVIGFPGTVAAQNLQARLTYAPTRSLTAYVAPAVLRSVHQDLEATVYRIGLGARYAVTPLVGLDLTYSLDSQHGAIEPLRATEEFSRGILSVGLTARWNSQRTGERFK